MIRPSARAQSLTHFLAMEIFERAHQLEARGERVIHLEVGEPDFPTVSSALRAAHQAVDDGHTRYTPSLGIPQLREAIAARIAGEYGVALDPDRVVVTTGSSAALVLAFAALLDPGDEILVADPGYPCYPNIARSLGANVRRVAVRASNGFVLDPADVRRAVGASTRAIVVGSPANPTGAMTDRATLEQLASIGPALVSDEIYHGLVYGHEAHTALEVCDDALIAGGFSKRYAMTGWRVGFLVVPRLLVRTVQALQQNLYISAPDVSQWAAIGAMDSGDEADRMRIEYDRRRRYLVDALPRVGLQVPVVPSGAFYVFTDARAFTDDSMAFALELLEHTGVAVTPGIDFGPSGEGFLRFAYATSMDNLQEAVERLGAYLAKRG